LDPYSSRRCNILREREMEGLLLGLQFKGGIWVWRFKYYISI